MIHHVPPEKYGNRSPSGAFALTGCVLPFKNRAIADHPDQQG
jgi:hypothetical protein